MLCIWRLLIYLFVNGNDVGPSASGQRSMDGQRGKTLAHAKQI